TVSPTLTLLSGSAPSECISCVGMMPSDFDPRSTSTPSRCTAMTAPSTTSPRRSVLKSELPSSQSCMVNVASSTLLGSASATPLPLVSVNALRPPYDKNEPPRPRISRTLGPGRTGPVRLHNESNIPVTKQGSDAAAVFRPTVAPRLYSRRPGMSRVARRSFAQVRMNYEASRHQRCSVARRAVDELSGEEAPEEDAEAQAS